MSRRIVALLATTVAATTLGLLGAPPPAGAEPRAATAASVGTVGTSGSLSAAAAETTDPLQVDLVSITPGVVPRRGPIRVSGTVTNLDSETWTTVRLYPFVSSTPLTTAAEVATASALPADAYVGDRIVEEDSTATVDEIAPGDAVPFSFEVPRSQLPVSDPGVYWFGVQALGQGPAGRDLVADGRARTLMPLLRPSTSPLELSVVVPLRRRVDLAADGRVDDLESWVTALSSGGRLSSLVDLGVSGASRAVTYVVDPALMTAARQLAAGNPPRSLRPTLPPGAGQGADDPEDPDGTGDGSGDGGDGSDGSDVPGDEESVQVEASPTAGDVDGDAVEDAEQEGEQAPAEAEQDPLTAEAQVAATDWLARLDRALAGHEVLALPYGDLDVAGAAEHDPPTYLDARSRSAEVLAALDVPASPVVASPGGYLDAPGLGITDPADTVLVSDAMFVGADDGADPATDPSLGGTPPTVITDAGRRLVVSSTAATTGPGPGDPRSTLSVRQSTLAQAAVRALGETGPGGSRQPLVLVLPHDWNPVASSGFFSGLDVEWLDLVPVTTIAAGVATPTALEELTYPRSQTRSELPALQFETAGDLRGAGERLQNMLTRNDQVARVVADQALTTLSYAARSVPARSRLAARAATSWIDDRMARVRVEAPRAFTMTGTVGTFSTTVVNDLAQPVTVALGVETDDGLSVALPAETVQVPASGRTRVLLRATAPAGGIHRVTVRLTDVDGGALGDSDTLTVRSLQVSNVIWVFLGAAAALLFGAIVFRLVKRFRAARRARRRGPPPGDDAAGPADAPRERVGDPAR